MAGLLALVVFSEQLVAVGRVGAGAGDRDRGRAGGVPEDELDAIMLQPGEASAEGVEVRERVEDARCEGVSRPDGVGDLGLDRGDVDPTTGAVPGGALPASGHDER